MSLQRKRLKQVVGEGKKNIPGGTKFSATVRTGPGAHPASSTMGTGSFPGVKRPWRGADNPPPSSVVERKE
jgi:hypothetical protein